MYSTITPTFAICEFHSLTTLGILFVYQQSRAESLEMYKASTLSLIIFFLQSPSIVILKTMQSRLYLLAPLAPSKTCCFCETLQSSDLFYLYIFPPAVTIIIIINVVVPAAVVITVVITVVVVVGGGGGGGGGGSSGGVGCGGGGGSGGGGDDDDDRGGRGGGDGDGGGGGGGKLIL